MAKKPRQRSVSSFFVSCHRPSTQASSIARVCFHKTSLPSGSSGQVRHVRVPSGDQRLGRPHASLPAMANHQQRLVRRSSGNRSGSVEDRLQRQINRVWNESVLHPLVGLADVNHGVLGQVRHQLLRGGNLLDLDGWSSADCFFLSIL